MHRQGLRLMGTSMIGKANRSRSGRRISLPTMISALRRMIRTSTFTSAWRLVIPVTIRVMQPSGYQITINNRTCDLTLHVNDKLWSLKSGEGGRFSADVWDRTQNHDTRLENAGYLLREKEADGRGNDVMEVAIPIGTFGNDINQSSTFTLKNPNCP